MILTGKLTGFDISGANMSAEIATESLPRSPLVFTYEQVLIMLSARSFISGIRLGDYVIVAVRDLPNPDGSYQAALPLVRHHISDLTS